MHTTKLVPGCQGNTRSQDISTHTLAHSTQEITPHTHTDTHTHTQFDELSLGAATQEMDSLLY